MGERHSWLLEPTFQQAIKVAATDERLTSDGGVILLREADHRLGLCEALAGRLQDPRRQDCIRYTLTELLRERPKTDRVRSSRTPSGVSAEPSFLIAQNESRRKSGGRDLRRLRPAERVLRQ